MAAFLAQMLLNGDLAIFFPHSRGDTLKIMSNQISIGPPVEELKRNESMKIPIVLRLQRSVKVA